MPQMLALPSGGPGRGQGRFMDREARIWAAEQGRGAKHEPITVLLVSPFETDHAALGEILGSSEFRLVSSRSAQEAHAVLRKQRVAVVIAECNLKDCGWKDMWCAIQRLPKRPRPRFIVAAEMASDVLWAEVLNLEAGEVLAKPFDPEEVMWCIKDAWLAWRRELELESAPKVQAARSVTA